MEFNPERFLGDHPEPDPRAAAFGFGRRICESWCFLSSPRVLRFVDPVLWIAYRLWFHNILLTRLLPLLRRTKITDPLHWVGPGINLAQPSVWLTCAMSLAVFDIEKYVDTFGNVVEPEIHYSEGLVR